MREEATRQYEPSERQFALARGACGGGGGSSDVGAGQLAVSRVHAALAGQGEMLGGLHEMISALESRLERGGVLALDPTKEQGNAITPPDPHALADRIDGYARWTGAAVGRLKLLLGRLEV